MRLNLKGLAVPALLAIVAWSMIGEEASASAPMPRPRPDDEDEDEQLRAATAAAQMHQTSEYSDAPRLVQTAPAREGEPLIERPPTTHLAQRLDAPRPPTTPARPATQAPSPRPAGSPVSAPVAPVPTDGGLDLATARRLAPTLAQRIRRQQYSTDRRLVSQFQRAAGLPQDGLYGGKTRGALIYFGVKDPPPALFKPTKTEAYRVPQ